MCYNQNKKDVNRINYLHLTYEYISKNQKDWQENSLENRS